ncbi:MAG: peptide deformylase [Parcubacteria group bacterium SW_6_46_9]|nr:MAG: peptide deformylase [Parcubacteria group bacterium SW_6_46_9]
MPEIVQKNDDTDVLRATAELIQENEFGSEELKNILADMKEALHDTDDGVAIAAPQIGISKRIFLVRDTVFAERGDLDTADHEFINPELVNTSQATVELDEGCLSVRNTYGKVTRYKQATVRAYDISGDEFEVGGSGLLAQIFQQEIEHLDGTLFVDKARDLREIDPEKRTHIKNRQ